MEYNVEDIVYYAFKTLYNNNTPHKQRLLKLSAAVKYFGDALSYYTKINGNVNQQALIMDRDVSNFYLRKLGKDFHVIALSKGATFITPKSIDTEKLIREYPLPSDIKLCEILYSDRYASILGASDSEKLNSKNNKNVFTAEEKDELLENLENKIQEYKQESDKLYYQQLQNYRERNSLIHAATELDPTCSKKYTPRKRRPILNPNQQKLDDFFKNIEENASDSESYATQ